MALNWCRSVAKFRRFSCCHQANGTVTVHNERKSNIKTFNTGKRTVTQYVQQTTFSLKKEQYLRELYNRRMKVGPEQERHPSKLGCWNIEAERYAFGQRLGEHFEEKWLRLALRCSSLRDAEISRTEELGISIETVVGDNTELAEQGQKLATKYILAYLRYAFPDLFEEGIRAVCDYLLSDETLLFIGYNLGLTDLIESSSYPPEDSEYITTFLAVIGALARSQGEERAKYFVLDFIVPQLINKDISDLWTVTNPMGIVAGILESSGRSPPESRVIYSSARNTIMAVHAVGIYSDKNLIGKSPGETLIIAEEMAARDALKNLMNLSDSRPPLVLGDRLRDVELDVEKLNKSVTEVLKDLPIDSKVSIER